MKLYISRFYEFLNRPLFPAARLILALLVIPLLLSFTAPLWKIEMEAAQYPEGLYLDIYAYKLEGGNDGQHINEINTLNHYIGMAPINRAALADLDWIPFALGALCLIALRTAAIGNVSSLVDLFVLTTYISVFSMGRFVYKLYTFGHNLSEDAPVKVEPFMPAVLGTKQIANFTTHSRPELGSFYLGGFVFGVVLLLGWHLISGRRRAAREAAREEEARRAAAADASRQVTA